MSNTTITVNFTVPTVPAVLTEFVDTARHLDYGLSVIASGFRSGFVNVSFYRGIIVKPIDEFTTVTSIAFKVYTTFRKAKQWLPTYDIHTLENHPKKVIAGLLALVCYSSMDESLSVPKLLLITNVALTILEFRSKPAKAVISLTTMAISWIDYKVGLPQPISLLWNRVLPLPMMVIDFYYEDSIIERIKIAISVLNYFRK